MLVWLVSLFWTSQSPNQGVNHLGFYKKTGKKCFQAHSGGWQNSALCGCRTEVRFLAGVSWEPLPAGQGHLHCVPHSTLQPQTSNGTLSPSYS